MYKTHTAQILIREVRLRLMWAFEIPSAYLLLKTEIHNRCVSGVPVKHQHIRTHRQLKMKSTQLRDWPNITFAEVTKVVAEKLFSGIFLPGQNFLLQYIFIATSTVSPNPKHMCCTQQDISISRIK